MGYVIRLLVVEEGLRRREKGGRGKEKSRKEGEDGEKERRRLKERRIS